MAHAAIKKLTPLGSPFRDQMERVFKETQRSLAKSREEEIESRLQGILRALKSEYEGGRVEDTERSDIPAFMQINKLPTRFHEVAKQLEKRHKKRSTLTITDEYDVQDLLHALLRIDFDDIRPEDRTPSVAGASARMDFVLRKEQAVIEVKKTRETLTDGKIGEELNGLT